MAVVRTIERRRPSWWESFRPAQADIIDQAVEAFESGGKVVIAEAPPGIGKTLTAVEIGQRLNVPTIYTATTKQLQEQANADFEWSRVLKGRNNYATQHGPEFVTCEDCLGEDCTYCDSRGSCPYTVAKRRALGADLAVLNTAYLLREINQPKSAFSGAEFVVVDEADTLENALMGYVEVGVSPRMQSTLRIKPPSRKTVERTWPEWLTDARKACGGYLGRTRWVGDLATQRQRRAVGRLAANITTCLDDLAEEEVSWIYDYSTANIVFKPVLVDHLAGRYLWQHANRFLLMSATIISHDLMAADLGVGDNWSGLTAPWVFPAENRPVYVRPVANMTRSQKDTEWPKMVAGVAEILARVPNDRVLVHCVSYDLAAYLTANLASGRVVTYRTASERLAALERYKSTPGSVLVAPSMERGVDLPDDMCRVQIITKVPWGNLGDKLVSARYHARGGRTWYAIQAIRAIIQATGRGVRHETDRATTIILDQQFLRLYRDWGHLMPEGWKEALRFKSAGVASMVGDDQTTGG